MRFRNKVNNLAVSGCSIERLFAHPDDDFDEYADMPSLLDINSVYNRDFMTEFIANHGGNHVNLERDFINYFINNNNWRRNYTRR